MNVNTAKDGTAGGRPERDGSLAHHRLPDGP